MATMLDKLMSLYPDVGESILLHTADIALYYQEGTPAHAWLDEQLEAKSVGRKPAKLSVFMGLFCTHFESTVKLNIGQARLEGWLPNPLTSATIEFEAANLAEANAKIAVVASVYTAPAWIAKNEADTENKLIQLVLSNERLMNRIAQVIMDKVAAAQDEVENDNMDLYHQMQDDDKRTSVGEYSIPRHESHDIIDSFGDR